MGTIFERSVVDDQGWKGSYARRTDGFDICRCRCRDRDFVEVIQLRIELQDDGFPISRRLGKPRAG